VHRKRFATYIHIFQQFASHMERFRFQFRTMQIDGNLRLYCNPTSMLLTSLPSQRSEISLINTFPGLAKSSSFWGCWACVLWTFFTLGHTRKKQYLATKASTFSISRFLLVMWTLSRLFAVDMAYFFVGQRKMGLPFGRIWTKLPWHQPQMGRGAVRRKDNSDGWLRRWNFFKGVTLIFF